MADEESNSGRQKLWYLRRRGQVKGPFPSGSLRRFVLIGRVLMDDQVSCDKSEWRLVSEVAEVIPPEVRKAMADGSLDDLIASRMREDERNGRERREQALDAKFKEKRKGERRKIEQDIEQHHRIAKTELLEAGEERKRPIVSMVVSSVLLLLVLAISFGLYLQAPEDTPDPDCTAAAAPAVNWRNCRLDGLQAASASLDGALLNNTSLRGAKLSGGSINAGDLQYADFTGADLSYVAMKSAMMIGVNLRNADLSYADLTGADLRFADLTGANLGSAVLDKARFDSAIWINGRSCLAGSVGGCLLPKK
ncbi:MAG: pentapeptide repeat-containing protein [Sedimenticola sp.]